MLKIGCDRPDFNRQYNNFANKTYFKTQKYTKGSKR